MAWNAPASCTLKSGAACTGSRKPAVCRKSASSSTLPATVTNNARTPLACSATTPATLSYFSLVVDDFGVRYGTQADIDHLEKTLNSNDYKITIRPEDDQYLGMNIAFNTTRTAVTISMPGYLQKILTRVRPQFLDTAHRPARTPGRYIAPI
jgi:hypothetical protein